MFLQWDSSSLSSCVMWRCSSFRMDSLMSRPDSRSVTRFLSRLRDDSEPANHRRPREEKVCAKMEPEGRRFPTWWEDQIFDLRVFNAFAPAQVQKLQTGEGRRDQSRQTGPGQTRDSELPQT